MTYSILCRVVTLTGAGDGNVGKQNVGAVCNPVVVLWAVAQVQVLYGRVVKADGTKQDWSQDIDILGIQVIPCLAVSIKETTAVDIYIISAKLEESRGVLEDLLKGMCLPVVSVVGELNISLNINVDVVEISEVQRRADNIFLALGKDDMAAVVALVDGRQDVIRIVGVAVIVRLDVADLVS